MKKQSFPRFPLLLLAQVCIPALPLKVRCGAFCQDKQDRPCRNFRHCVFPQNLRRSRILSYPQPFYQAVQNGRTTPTQSRRRNARWNRTHCDNPPDHQGRFPWRGSIHTAQEVCFPQAFQDSLSARLNPSTYLKLRQARCRKFRQGSVCFHNAQALYHQASL